MNMGCGVRGAPESLVTRARLGLDPLSLPLPLPLPRVGMLFKVG